jgi:hypothetical protein
LQHIVVKIAARVSVPVTEKFGTLQRRYPFVGEKEFKHKTTHKRATVKCR